MTGFTREDVISRLDEITDPCSAATHVPLSIVELGMVEDVRLDSGNVVVALRMTSPLCHAYPTSRWKSTVCSRAFLVLVTSPALLTMAEIGNPII
jgi:hypothetical protein